MLSTALKVIGGLIVSFISGSGYLGIVLLMAIESACIPLPSEVIMPFAGFLVYKGHFGSLFMVATWGAVGCNLGSLVAYELGSHGGRPLIERWGRYIFLRQHELDRAEVWFDRYGQVAVLVSRVLPVVRTFISLPAGIAEMLLRSRLVGFDDAQAAKAPGGDDIRDVARNQHSAADQEPHQDRALLRMGKRGTDFGRRQCGIVHHRGNRIEPEQHGTRNAGDVHFDQRAHPPRQSHQSGNEHINPSAA